MGKVIVFILLVLSIISWTIILEKWSYFRLLKRQSTDFVSLYRGLDDPLDLFLNLKGLHGPLQIISDIGLKTISTILQLDSQKIEIKIRSGQFEETLSDVDFEFLHSAIEEAVDNEVLKMEENLGVLGSIVSSSPFLGLLGTVWGVMMAFSGMALKGKADINAIAPGVSGALLTTVVALLVAIPALVGYNHLAGAVKQLTMKLDHFAGEFVNLLKLRYSDRKSEI